MEPRLKILHLEEQNNSGHINKELSKVDMHFDNVVVDTKAAFMSALQQYNPDLILADHSVNSFGSIEALKAIKESHRDIPFLLVANTASKEMANNIVSEGAMGYILQEDLESLPEAIKEALDKSFSKAKNNHLNNNALPEEKLYDLQMLEAMDDNEYLVEIVSIFLNETPKELKEMNAAATAKKSGILSNKAHKLKSSSGLLEANKLSKILEEIEVLAKSDNPGNEMIKLVEAATIEYKKIEAALKAHLKTIA